MVNLGVQNGMLSKVVEVQLLIFILCVGLINNLMLKLY